MKQVFALGTAAAAFALVLGCGGSGGGTSGGGGTPVNERIAVNDTIGGRPRIFVNDVRTGSFLQQAESATARNESPALSPDGTKIAFISNRSGSDELYVMTVNETATLQRLTTDTTVDASPAWISGNRLVWTKSVGGTDDEIVAMNLDGTGFAQLTNNAENDILPAVSPNGGTVAFIRPNGGTSYQIYTLPSVGGAATLVTTVTTTKPSVSWQDNGSLLFTARDGGVENCMRINASGGAVSKITEGWGPKISATGGRIMFARTADGKPELFTTTTSGGGIARYSFTPEGVIAWDWQG